MIRYVYFIQIGEDGPVKIGSSHNPLARLAALQAANAAKLRLLAAIPSSTEFNEQQLHRMYRKHRIRGEWFDPVTELVEIGDRLAQILEQAMDEAQIDSEARDRVRAEFIFGDEAAA